MQRHVAWLGFASHEVLEITFSNERKQSVKQLTDSKI